MIRAKESVLQGGELRPNKAADRASFVSVYVEIRDPDSHSRTGFKNKRKRQLRLRVFVR
jgi:hypothetical protein